MTYDGQIEWKPDASRFEFGTRALADFAGFDYAISWLQNIGLDKIHGRIQDLVQYAIESSKSIKKFGIASPENRADRTGIFIVRLPSGYDGSNLYNKLLEKDRILTSPVRVNTDLRIAIHFFNTKDEIKMALDALDRYCS